MECKPEENDRVYHLAARMSLEDVRTDAKWFHKIDAADLNDSHISSILR